MSEYLRLIQYPDLLNSYKYRKKNKICDKSCDTSRASTFTKFCKRLHEFQKSKRFRLHAITVLNLFIVADR